jgi:hypothetical protein
MGFISDFAQFVAKHIADKLEIGPYGSDESNEEFRSLDLREDIPAAPICWFFCPGHRNLP